MRTCSAAMIGLIALSACESSTEPNLRGVYVNTSVTPNREVANHFTVTTTVENAGRNPVRLEVSPCPRRFRVEAMSGEVVALRSQICDAAARTRSLVPGERYDFSDQWDGKDVNGTALSGEYRIVGQPYSSAGPSGNPVTVYIVR